MIIIVTLSLLITIPPVKAEKSTGLTWSNTYVSGQAYSVQSTQNQEGFIVAGYAGYGWVMKTDLEGNPEWNNYYTPTGYLTSGYLFSGAPVEARDGGYILAGRALSIGYTTGYDAWLVRLDRGGNVEWSKTYGGPKDDYFLMVSPTRDGGFVAVGNTELVRCCSSGWVVKTDSSGNVVWEETFVGEDIHAVAATRDGGVLVTGAVEIAGNNVGLWVFKLDAAGEMVWQHAYDISRGSFPVFVASSTAEQTRDGGYIVAANMGRAGSFNGPKPLTTFFARLDSKGGIVWQETYGDGIGRSTPTSIQETRDGGFIAAGYSDPQWFADGTFRGVSGSWLLRLGAMGNIVWQRIYEKSMTFGVTDVFSSVRQTQDGGYVAAGFLGDLDSAWVLKTDSNGNIEGCSSLGSQTNLALIDGNAVMTEPSPAVTAVPTHATVNQTSVIVKIVTTSQLKQCTPETSDNAGDKDELSATQVEAVPSQLLRPINLTYQSLSSQNSPNI